MSGTARGELHGVLGATPGAVDAIDWAAALAPGAAAASVRAPHARVAAGWSWSAGEIGIAARRAPLLWESAGGRWLAWRDDQGRSLVSQLLRGELLVASDEPLVLWTREATVLRSSAAGGSVIFWTAVAGGWAFAQALPLLARARTAPVDPVGLAELARFGGSYTARTVLEGLARVPYGHELVLAGGAPAVRPYASFDSRPERWSEPEAERAIGERLASLAAALPARRHVMYSGGVDSSLLAALLRRAAGETVGVNLALGDADPEAEHARRVAEAMGLAVVRGRIEGGAERLEATVASYASPTLDFSILPTHQVGELARAAGATTLVDGTGGDAWFGFGALANERIWRRVHLAWPIRHLAARAYGRLATLRDSRAWLPLKVVARAPRRADAALAHLCASPLHDVIWGLDREAWANAEDEVAASLDALLGGRPQAPWQRMLAADGVFIAGGVFAAKSGAWSLVRDQGTVYPFLTPGLVEVARRLPLAMMLRQGVPKPLLKELAVHAGIARAAIYRKKSGFQPPLATLMRDPGVRGFVEARIARAHELDPLVTPAARRLTERLLKAGDRPSIHVLYPFWNLLSMRLWLDAVRSGAAARRWCD